MLKVFSHFTFLTIILFSTNSHSQFHTEKSLIDAFRIYVNNTKENDTERVNGLTPFLISASENDWQHAWIKIQIKRAELFSGLYQLKDLTDVIYQALPIAKSLDLIDEKITLQALLIEVSFYDDDIKIDSSPEEILSEISQMKNDEYQNIAKSALSLYYIQKEDYINALNLTLTLNLQENDEQWLENQALKTSLLAEIYFQVDDTEKYTKYSNESIALYEQMDDLTGKAIVMYNLIDGLLTQKKFEDIVSYLPEWEKAVSQAGDVTIEGDLYRIKGALALHESNYSLAKNLLVKSKIIYDEHNLDYYEMLSDLILLEIIFKEGNMLQARNKLLRIEKSVDTYAKTKELVTFYQLVTDVYKNLNDYKLAFKYGEALNINQLKISDKKNSLEILKLEYEQSLKDKELQKNILSEQQKQQNTIYILIIFFTILGLFFVVIFLYKQTDAKRKLSVIANTDTLTGAPNRRAILSEAELNLRECKQRNLPLTIAIADIDLFKSVNDDFGHDVGDEVLKFFANSASHTIRKSDYYGRFGGEEWLFVLPQTEVEFTQKFFDRLCTAVAKKNDAFDLGERVIEFSMGATQLSEGDTIKSMINRADKLLYQAKEHGRNRVCY